MKYRYQIGGTIPGKWLDRDMVTEDRQEAAATLAYEHSGHGAELCVRVYIQIGDEQWPNGAPKVAGMFEVYVTKPLEPMGMPTKPESCTDEEWEALGWQSPLHDMAKCVRCGDPATELARTNETEMLCNGCADAVRAAGLSR